MKWTLKYSRQAESNINRLHPRDKLAIKDKLEECVTDPLHLTKHLVGNLQGLRSLRKGKVRAVVSLHDEALTVYVERVEYRGNSY